MLYVADNDFEIPISRQIWETKYRDCRSGTIRDKTIHDIRRRVARACAQAERQSRGSWEARFYQLLTGFNFLPGGRILAGAATGRQVTLGNCFVMGTIEDAMDGILDALKEAALTMQQGGGIGCDFSTLRPSGTRARGTGIIASGPVSFMHIGDCMCATLLSTGTRRGTMMASLRCDHPDIERFIDVKQDRRSLKHFNLSILISDDFMKAVQKDVDWPLLFR
jgi:ribonucleoside-diphosphate reductase alpha chain